MGILETIDGMDLSDEQKDKLRQEYSADVDPLKTENDSLKAKDRRSSVEEEVKALGGIGLSAAPGLLKFYRRVLLSGDAEEPGEGNVEDAEGIDLPDGQVYGEGSRRQEPAIEI